MGVWGVHGPSASEFQDQGPESPEGRSAAPNFSPGTLQTLQNSPGTFKNFLPASQNLNGVGWVIVLDGLLHSGHGSTSHAAMHLKDH